MKRAKLQQSVENGTPKRKFNWKMLLTMCMVLAMLVVSCVTCFAAEGDATGAAEAVAAAETVLASVTAVLNITNVAAILAACMGSATILFLAWWGVRKVVKVTVNAFSRGKLSI